MMPWSRLGAAGIVALLGCEPGAPPPAVDGGAARPTSPSATSAALPQTAVGYDCAGFPSQVAPACDATPEWLATVERFGVYVTDPGMTRATAAQCLAAKAALGEALAAPLAPLGTSARIVAQNAALRLFVAAPSQCREAGVEGLAEAAAPAIERLALPAAELEALGSAPPPELDAWIGARDGWRDMMAPVAERDRAGREASDTLFHDRADRHTRIFRAIRAGSIRAIFSQLIAIDRAWRPHVTPVVAKMELRRGLDASAAACAARLDVGAIGCGAFLVQVATLDDLPISRFLFRVGDGHVGCNRCHDERQHTGANLLILDRDAGDRHRADVSAAVLAEARRHAQQAETWLARRRGQR